MEDSLECRSGSGSAQKWLNAGGGTVLYKSVFGGDCSSVFICTIAIYCIVCDTVRNRTCTTLFEKSFLPTGSVKMFRHLSLTCL